MADLLDGSFGPFRVRADLGHGRFGRHYRGEAGEGGDPVVIRTFTARLESAQRQALLEALQWLCETPLDHQAIAVPLACGIEGDVPFFVHAFAPGVPLDEFLDRRGPQPFDEVVVRLAQLGGAIDFAAAAGVHHGALDARDILLGPQGAAILGFGLAQAAAQAGFGLDTRGPYDSPQQQSSEPVTHADDVYALAVVALQMLCGTADQSQNPRTLLGWLQQEGLSQELAAIFESALSDDPRLRPATALAFVAALQSAVGHVSEDAGQTRVTEGDITTGTFGGPGTAASFDTDPAFRPHQPASVSPAWTTAQDPESGRPAADENPGELSLLLEFMPERHEAETAAEPGDAGMPRRPGPSRTGERQGITHAAVGTTQLPLDLMLGDRTKDAFHDVELGDPSWDDGPPESGRAAPLEDPGVFRTLGDDRDRDTGLSGWVVRVAAVAVVGVLAGVAVLFLLSRTTGSIPFPGSAAPASATPSRQATPNVEEPRADSGAQDEPAGAAPTVVPNGPPVVTSVPEPISEPLPESIPRDGAARENDIAPAAPSARPPDRAASPPASSAPAAPQASRGVPVSPRVEPSAPAPPRPAEEPAALLPGRILVRSLPAGAQVIVDGKPQPGTTPLPVRDLPIGAHTIVVTHPSFGSREERVTLTAAAPARSIDIDFGQASSSSPTTSASPPVGPVASPAARFGALYVESRPAGAQVFVDDRLVGKTPMLISEVEVGPRRVRLELSGYRAWSTSVTVISGDRTRVAASLEP